MDINHENMDTLFRALRRDFEGAYKHGESPEGDAIATTIPSSTSSTRFDWLGDLPEMREWLDRRELHQLASYNYEVFVKHYEVSFRADRTQIEDDNIGIYKLKALSGGEAARLLKVREVTKALSNGDTGLCHDGQPFFDESHPVGEDGDIDLVSNLFNDGDGVEPWYLMDTTRTIKPIIAIDRQKARFQSITDLSNLHVFMHKEFLFGADARMGTGYGLWFTAGRNEGTVNYNNLDAMYKAMVDYRGNKKNEDGRRKKLGIKPNLIVCAESEVPKFTALIKDPWIRDKTDPLGTSANQPIPNPYFNRFSILGLSYLD